MNRTVASCLMLLTTFSVALSAQTDHDEIRAVIHHIFDGMREGDSAKVRAKLMDGATLGRATERNGQPTLTSGPADGWLRSIGTPHDQVFDEKVWDIEIQVDGRLATAWMKFAFFLGPQFSHCGVNAMQFFKTEEGWKVFSVVDTSRRGEENCWMPPR